MTQKKVQSQKDLDNAVKRIRELEMAVAQKEANSQDKKGVQAKQLEQLQRELVASRYDRAQAENRIRGVESVNHDKEEGLISTTAQVRNLEEVIAEAKASNLQGADKAFQLKQLVAELENLTHAREAAENRATKLEQERDQSRAQLHVSSSIMTQLEQDIDKQKKDGAAKAEHLAELKRLESELEKSRQNSEVAQDHIQELEDERNRNYQELARSGKQIDGLVTEISNRETEVHLREEQQSQELKRLKKALKGTLDKSRDAQEQLAKVKAEQDETNEKLGKAGGNVNLLLAKLDQIKVEQKRNVEEQRHAISSDEKNRLQDKLDNLHESLEEKQKALSVAESEKQGLEKIASDKKHDLSQLEDALNEAQQEAEKAKLKREEAEREKDQIEGALNQMRESAEMMRNQAHDEYNEEGGSYLWVSIIFLAVLMGGGYYYFINMETESDISVVMKAPVIENSTASPIVVTEETIAPAKVIEAPIIAKMADGIMGGDQFQDKLRNGKPGPEMVQIKGAEYSMGDKRNGGFRDSRPAHNVNITSFAAGLYEVSFAEYDAFATASGKKLPSDQGWGRGNHPVINVSWQDAVDYTVWLSRQTGKNYRLLSESEWEFIARGGKKTNNWWGNARGNNKANCFDCGSQWDGNKTSPVGKFRANAFGVFNTAGNVREWTADCYHLNYKGAPEDGSVWDAPRCKERVVRGGAFNRPALSMLNSKRGFFEPKTRIGFLGFRIARDL